MDDIYSGRSNRYVVEKSLGDGRGLINIMYQKNGKAEGRVCRMCIQFSRSRKTFTAGHCAVICRPGSFCWRGDWTACGLIDKEVTKKMRRCFRANIPPGVAE
jgi:hypothetical protein